MDKTVFERWQSRIEKGLMRLAGTSPTPQQGGRYSEVLTRSRNLLKLSAPVSRLFNSLGELSLSLGFQFLSILLLQRSERLAPKDPVPRINLSRAQLSLANKFLLRAPRSGAVAHNLQRAKKQVDALTGRKNLPENKLVEVTLLGRRIDDRMELWKDFRRGEFNREAIRKILAEENDLLRVHRVQQIPNLAELEKLEPKRVGFYYREYRKERAAVRERRRK